MTYVWEPVETAERRTARLERDLQSVRARRDEWRQKAEAFEKESELRAKELDRAWKLAHENNGAAAHLREELAGSDRALQAARDEAKHYKGAAQAYTNRLHDLQRLNDHLTKQLVAQESVRPLTMTVPADQVEQLISRAQRTTPGTRQHRTIEELRFTVISQASELAKLKGERA